MSEFRRGNDTIWRGNLSMRVYIPSKPDRFGIKAFSVNESCSAYTVGFEVYTGRWFQPYPDADNTDVDEGQSYKIVMGLLSQCNLLHKGHSIYMDSYYMSPVLVDALGSRDTIAVGTTRPTRKEMPEALRKTKLEKGEAMWRRRGDLLAMKWHDKHDVTVLSNGHTATWGIDGKKVDAEGLPVLKPTAVLEYNKYMGGTDMADQLCRYYPLLRRRNRWYRKLFFSLLGLLVTNAYILWKKFAPEVNTRQVSHAAFRLQVVELLVESAVQAPVPTENLRARRSTGFSIRRLTERHFPSKIQPKDGAANIFPIRECVVCKQQLKSSEEYQLRYLQEHRWSRVRYPVTRFECRRCAVPLCVDKCFEIYHTYKHYDQIDLAAWHPTEE